MAVIFSDINLRVPPGFGNILEGLAREVLRDQPEDIPTFAAQYFKTLLQKREESGLDPVKCGELMVNRFSNNDAFRDVANQESCSPVKETGSSVNEACVFQAESYENNEDKITQPTQNTSTSPETPEASEDIVKPEPQPDNKLNESEEESDEIDPEPNLEFLYKGTADIDICAEELDEMEKIDKQMPERVQEHADVDEENEVLSSYHGLADVDVCSEELQSTLQEEEHTESPEPVLDEQDVLDTHDEFPVSGTETSVYVEQDIGTELNDIYYNEEAVASPVNEDEIGETGQLSEDVREMSNTLFDDAGPEIPHVEQPHLNEGAESISVSDEESFDETNTDEIPLGVENQQADDMLAAEAMSESSFIRKESSLADRSNEDRPEVEATLSNVASDAQEENNNCEGVTDLIDATDEMNSQIDMEEDDTDNDTQTDPVDINETILGDNMEGLMDNNLNLSGFPVGNVNKNDTRASHQDVDEVEDSSEIEIGNDDDVNALETQEDNLSFTHESNETYPRPTSEEPEQDMEISYKQSSTDSQMYTKEPETATDYEESEHQKDLLHESILESENKEVDQQEESSHPQEEEDIMDIPLDDPEANKAAAKIQAGFRGHMTRKKLKPGDKPGEEVSSTGETLNGSQGDAAGGSEGVETDETSVPEQ